MASDTSQRCVEDSRVRMTEIVLPEDTNPKGTIFGGRVLALIDKCAAIAAMRHARTDVVTASLDSVTFLNKVRLGDVLLLGAKLNAAFHTSMEVEVSVCSEDPKTGEQKLTTTALVTMVAVDDVGRPRAIPGLSLRTDEERVAAGAADARRRNRLAARRPG